jgi:acyl-CoA reductase-like NAD-dependent aldehyde dehydrogenase
MSSTSRDLRVRSFDRIFVGGQWVKPATPATIEVISPVTEEAIASTPEANNEDVDNAVAAARRAFDSGPWPRMSPAERGAAILRIRDEVEARLEEMALAFTGEIGTPIAVSRAFHQLALRLWEDAGTFHREFEFEEDRSTPDGEFTVIREPVGVVAVIIPWNGPTAACALKIGPALAAGCTVVVKPPPETPVSPLLLAEAIEAAGLPEGVVSVLPAGREVGEHLVTHPGVDKVSFTGSTAAGRRIMGLCADRITRVTLELGGKSAAILAEDADLEEVLPSVVPAGIGHSGQVCAALTRVIVPRARQEEVVAGIVELMDGFTVGDPMDPSTVLGPLAAERQRDRVEGYIERGKAEGARLVTGGGRPADLATGWYVEPTLFADVDNSTRIAQEEIFGPVLTVIPVDSLDEAIDVANDSPYGLSGAVYTADPAVGERVAREVRTGQMCVNTWDACVLQPFGGYKQSGMGREGNLDGLSAFLETKVVQRPSVAALAEAS